VQDAPEEVLSSHIQSLGVIPERDELTSACVPLKRKKTVLGIEGGVANVDIEWSASVDEGRVV
jgi:hypothetical protein